MFATLRRVVYPAIILLFWFAAISAFAQDQYYNESIPVGSSGTLSYQLEIENGACGGQQQMVANVWSGFTFTPTGGSGFGLNPEVDYVYPCGAYNIDGGWDYQSNNNSNTASSFDQILSPTVTINGQSCTVTVTTYQSSGPGSDATASIACAPPPPIAFTNSGGTVTMSTNLPNATIFYTLDGSEATEGSIEYTDPVTVPSGTTINAVAVQTSNNGVQGIEIQQGQQTVDDWKTVLASTSAQSSPYAGDYSTPLIKYCATQYCNQGVQGIPTTIDFLSSGSFPSASPQGSTTAANLAFTTEDLQGTYPNNQSGNPPNETQVLWPYNTGSTGCDSCTSIVEDFYIWPQNTQYVSPSNVQEWEMDLETWDHGDLNWLNAGLQCSVLDGGWEYSYQGAPRWTLLKDANNNTLNHDCPLPSGTLSAAITSSTQTTFTVTPAAANSTVEPGMIVLVDNEEIFCTAVSGNECTSAKRGYGGTTATTHSQGALWAGSVHVQYHMHRNPGDLACTNGTNAVECISIDYLNLNYYPSISGTNNDNNNNFSALTVPAAPLSSTWPDRVFNQQQMNVAHGIGSQDPLNPVKVGEFLDQDDVTASWGVLGRGSYVVP